MKNTKRENRTSTALHAFKEILVRRYDGHLKSALLFGSRARGDHRPDSDADVAVFLDTVSDPIQEQLDLIDESYPILLSSGINIQPWVFDADSLRHPERHRASRLIESVQKEGVRI
jgi:predicted nucleotidyltransferase